MNFSVQKVGQRFGLGGVLLAAVWAMPAAHAIDPTPIFSFSGVQTQGSNLGYSPSAEQSVSRWLGSTWSSLLNSKTVTKEVWDVTTAPTTTMGGVETLFKVTTLTEDFQDYQWIYDNASISTDGQTGQLTGGKWISISGSITSSIDLSISPWLDAYGSFTPVSTPFGDAAPALASLYFGSSMASLSQGSISSYSDSGSATYSVYASGGSMSFLAGQSQTFVALAYAPEGVSLDGFEVGWYRSSSEPIGSAYKKSDTSREYLGSRPLAPIPEPETYALALAGLGVVGWMARRRRA